MYEWKLGKYTVLSDYPRYQPKGFAKPGGATWLKPRAMAYKHTPFKPPHQQRGFAKQIDYKPYLQQVNPPPPFKQQPPMKPWRDWRSEQAVDDHDQRIWLEFMRINKALDLERRRKEYFKKRLKQKDYRSQPWLEARFNRRRKVNKRI